MKSRLRALALLIILSSGAYLFCSQPPLKRTDSCSTHLAHYHAHGAKCCQVCGKQAQTFQIVDDKLIKYFCFSHYPVCSTSNAETVTKN